MTMCPRTAGSILRLELGASNAQEGEQGEVSFILAAAGTLAATSNFPEWRELWCQQWCLGIGDSAEWGLAMCAVASVLIRTRAM